MSRAIIINGSPRKNGVDSNIASMISEEFSAKGHTVDVLDICRLSISGCTGCMSCRKTGTCVQDDDMNGIIAKIRGSDMLILMSPIYFAAETGQMKIFTDRLTSAFTEKRPLGDVKAASILLTCADPEGDKKYGSTLKRMLDEVGYRKVEDRSGVIIGGLSPDTLRDSPKVRDYLDGLTGKL